MIKPLRPLDLCNLLGLPAGEVTRIELACDGDATEAMVESLVRDADGRIMIQQGEIAKKVDRYRWLADAAETS